MQFPERNSKKREIASQFYMETLGVGVANPNHMEDYVSGGAATVMVNEGNLVKEGQNLFDRDSFGEVSTPFTGNAFKEAMNPNASYSGNLALVRREIESQTDIERLDGVKFIEIQSRTVFQESEEAVKVSPIYREIAAPMGKSIFLDYSLENDQERRAVQKKAPPTDESNKGGTSSGR